LADCTHVIDRLAAAERIIVASCCSGHGFKHSAAIGESIAKLVTAGTATELAPFRWPA